MEQVKAAGGVVSGTVIEVVKGGLIVDIGLRGFLPASLVDLRRVRDLQPYVGTAVEAKIIELDKNRNNVVLSRRAWLEEAQKEQREEFLDNLKPGEVRRGVVSSVVPFGAFIDLGGMDGLVHVSELSWRHVDHPSSVVSVGDEVEVQVLEVDPSRERISLSLKATQQDPWQEFAATHRVGELVYGRVTKLVPFGAFVQVGESIEGLTHISEMSAHHVEVPEQVVTPGEELWVKIIDIDLQRRRISLSIKQAAEGGVVAAEFQEHFGEHAFDEQGNYLGAVTEEEPAFAAEDYSAENHGGDTGVAEDFEAVAPRLRDSLPTLDDRGRSHRLHRLRQVHGRASPRGARRPPARRRCDRGRTAAAGPSHARRDGSALRSVHPASGRSPRPPGRGGHRVRRSAGTGRPSTPSCTRPCEPRWRPGGGISPAPTRSSWPTSRCSPRPGPERRRPLAGIIVVDIDPEVAVRRLVADRGPDRGGGTGTPGAPGVAPPASRSGGLRDRQTTAHLRTSRLRWRSCWEWIESLRVPPAGEAHEPAPGA